MKRNILICTLFILLLSCSFSFAGEYLDVTPDYKVKIPDDFYYKKDYRVQWWYFTGHLFDKNGREFGYELTFFVVNVQKRQYKSRFGVNHIYISHFAVSDVMGRKFYFSDKADSGVYGFAGSDDKKLRVWMSENILEGTVDEMNIMASGEDISLELRLIPEKMLVLHGEKGYSRKSEKSPLISSIYFSITNLKTKGTLKIGKEVFYINGRSWFDREISSKELDKEKEGWDWFSIQLDDKREIMIYILRNKDGSIDRFSSGTFIYPDGRYRHLIKDDFSIKILDHYTSEKTGADYPSKWEIEIPSEKLLLTITPLLQDQEFIAYKTTGNYYWEGTCKVDGTAKGRAYVEMTGY